MNNPAIGVEEWSTVRGVQRSEGRQIGGQSMRILYPTPLQFPYLVWLNTGFSLQKSRFNLGDFM
jgi:hypothetical protein